MKLCFVFYKKVSLFSKAYSFMNVLWRNTGCCCQSYVLLKARKQVVIAQHIATTYYSTGKSMHMFRHCLPVAQLLVETLYFSYAASLVIVLVLCICNYAFLVYFFYHNFENVKHYNFPLWDVLRKLSVPMSGEDSSWAVSRTAALIGCPGYATNCFICTLNFVFTGLPRPESSH